MSQSIQSTDTTFSVTTDQGRVAGFRVLFVSHSNRWETESGEWREEEFMINVSDPRSLKTCSVSLSRDEAAILSTWLTDRLA
jgi:hypothetical protein